MKAVDLLFHEEIINATEKALLRARTMVPDRARGRIEKGVKDEHC